MTVSSDGNVPVQFRSGDGNTEDSTTHLETWKALVELTGRPDFLYVADSKLCAGETLDEIDALKGRFVTVLPRSRNEDRQFRKRIQDFVPPWEKVRDRPNPRRKGLARDVWYVYRHPVPSAEAWPVTWVYGKLLEKKQRKRRQDRIEAASAALEKLNEKLRNLRSKRAHRRERVEEAAEKIVRRYKVKKYLSYWSHDFDINKFRQDGPGRPGQGTRYRKETD